MTTTTNDFSHSHSWLPDDKMTGFGNGHQHELIKDRSGAVTGMKPAGKDNHIHSMDVLISGQNYSTDRSPINQP